MAGRPRTATNILEAKGAFKKDPQRRKARENEPIVTEPIGMPPTYLDEKGRECWFYILKCAPKNVLTRADNLFVGNLAFMMAKLYDKTITNSEMTLLQQGLGRIGMNPSDRSRVSAPQDKPASRWDNLGK